MQAYVNSVNTRPIRRPIRRRPCGKAVYHRPFPNTVKGPSFWERVLDRVLFLATCFAVVVAFAFVLSL